MKFIEATISLLVFLIFITTVLAGATAHKTDDSLYRYELASDVWRVLYLRGDFHNFAEDSLNPARDATEKDLTRITDLTGLCMNIEGVRVQSAQCRGEELGRATVITQNRLISNGVAKDVIMTITPKTQ